MKAVVRIHGQIGLRRDIIETFNRLKLRRKYVCIVLNPSKEQEGMIKKLRDFVAYGDINDKTLVDLIEKRGQPIDKSKKINSKMASEGIKSGKSFKEFNMKPFFRLHPPRKGIDAKKHFGIGKGVLGNNKEKINELIGRML